MEFNPKDGNTPWRFALEGTDTSTPHERASEFCIKLMRTYPGSMAVAMRDTGLPVGAVIMSRPPVGELVQDVRRLKGAALEYVVYGGDCPNLEEFK